MVCVIYENQKKDVLSESSNFEDDISFNVVVRTNFTKVLQCKQSNRKNKMKLIFFIKIDKLWGTIFLVIFFYKRIYPYNFFTLITI